MKNLLLILWNKMSLGSKIQGIIILLLVGSILTVFFQYKREMRKLERELENAEEIATQILVDHWKADSLTKVELVEEIDSLKGVISFAGDMILYWKNSYFKIENAKVETLYVDDLNSILGYKHSFEDSNDCMKVQGDVWTNPFKIEFIAMYKPVKLDIAITSIRRKKVYGKATTNNPCLIVEDLNFTMAKDLNIEMGKRNWFGYGLGAKSELSTENEKISLKNWGVSGGIRFWSMHTTLSTDFKKMEIGCMLWF